MVLKYLKNIFSNFVGDSNDENKFPHKLLLSNTQVFRLPTAFANNYSAKIIKDYHNC